MMRHEARGDPDNASAFLDSKSPLVHRMLATAEQAARSDATVLLTGESGTGKSLLAAAIHRWSRRSAGPYITIPCATSTERDLFGHMKGAFVGAWRDQSGRLDAAQGGTIFLDEVAELAPNLRAKLLQVIDERRFERVGGNEAVHVDGRMIAATKHDLDAEVRSGEFPQDLYFRLNVIGIRVPPLRERPEDLPPLTDALLSSLCSAYGRAPLCVANDARELLLTYQWPGNIRELANALERAVVLVPDDILRAEHFLDRLSCSATPTASTPQVGSLEELERQRIRQVVAASPTLGEAAARLGINPTTLWRKRKRYGIA